MALELSFVTLGERDPELPQVGYELLFEGLGRRLGRAFSSWQHRARAIKPVGWSSGDVFFTGTAAAREVRPGGGDSDPLARGELENDPWLISFPEAITHRPEPGPRPALMPDDANDLSPPG